MKIKSKLDLLRAIENMDEGLAKDQARVLMKLVGFFEENPSFIAQYKDFYDDIKTKVREDW